MGLGAEQDHTKKGLSAPAHSTCGQPQGLAALQSTGQCNRGLSKSISSQAENKQQQEQQKIQHRSSLQNAGCNLDGID